MLSSKVQQIDKPHIGRKVSLIASRQILPKVLSLACIFSYTIMAYLKNLDGTKSLNTKQYPAGLPPRIIPQTFLLLPKMSPLLMLFFCTYHIWTVPPSSEPSWETLGIGKNPTQ